MNLENPAQPVSEPGKPFQFVPARTIALFHAFGAIVPDEITPDAVVDTVISFANRDVSPDPLGYIHVEDHDDGSVHYFVEDMELGEFRLMEVDENQATEDGRITIEKERVLAIEMLSDAAAGTFTLSARIAAMGNGIGRWNPSGITDVRLRPVFNVGSLKSGSRPLSWKMEGPKTARGWIIFAALLIADSACGDKTDIGRCKWSECGKFFRVKIEGRGQPTRDYCPKTNHREKTRLGTSTERVRKLRAKRKLEAAAKRRKPARAK